MAWKEGNARCTKNGGIQLHYLSGCSGCDGPVLTRDEMVKALDAREVELDEAIRAYNRRVSRRKPTPAPAATRGQGEPNPVTTATAKTARPTPKPGPKPVIPRKEVKPVTSGQQLTRETVYGRPSKVRAHTREVNGRVFKVHEHVRSADAGEGKTPEQRARENLETLFAVGVAVPIGMFMLFGQLIAALSVLLEVVIGGLIWANGRLDHPAPPPRRAPRAIYQARPSQRRTPTRTNNHRRYR
jgi:hypothetical protein